LAIWASRNCLRTPTKRIFDFSECSPAEEPMLLQLQDYGTSLWQLRDQAISLPSRLKGRGLLSVQSEAPSTIFFLQCVSPEL
jgi:hypothetical protein